jgi:hypothetical protein
MGRGEYVHDTFKHAGFTVKIIQDPDPDEPDYGEAEFYLYASCSGHGHGSYEIGRRNVQDGNKHIPWGEFIWGQYGSDIPTEENERAWDLYQEWLDCYDSSYQVWPIKAGNAHGPGSFTIWECDEDDEIEGYVFIKVPDTDLGKLGDASRDVEKIKDALIEQYQQWCRGEVYGYVIEDSDGEEIESCWGYYGDEDAISESKSTAEALAKDSHARDVTFIVLRTNKTWEYLTVRVPLYVGTESSIEWARTSLDIGEDETVQELIVPREQLWLFEPKEFLTGSTG